jgi:hypothetical protein
VCHHRNLFRFPHIYDEIFSYHVKNLNCRSSTVVNMIIHPKIETLTLLRIIVIFFMTFFIARRRKSEKYRSRQAGKLDGGEVDRCS